LSVSAAAVAHLRREGLIEGRMPHPHISAVVAEATGQQAEYMRKKELPGSRYRAMLIDYIGKFNGLSRKQINDYKNNQNYSYTGILKALTYFYEVKGNSTEKANGGIGIVPYVYQDAYNYYYHIWMAKQTNEVKPIEQYSAPPARVIVIPPPKRVEKKRKLFSFLDEEE
jgi:hypothetical protein